MMITVEEAWSLIEQNPLVRRTETKSLEFALSHVLARTVRAKIDQPRTDLSAMDGYAVRLDDVSEAGTILRVVDKVPAGAVPSRVVNSGEAIRVFTGSAIPDGANHIVIQEDVDIQDSTIRVSKGYSHSSHIRKKGLDFSSGAEIISEGQKLGAVELLAIASANYAEIEVYSRAKVAILSNGDELRSPGAMLKAGEIPNSNAIGLKSLLETWGAEVCYSAIAQDHMESIQSHIEQIGTECDVIVPVGGASVGEYDLMKTAFANNAFETIFNKVAVKPGKPAWFSRRKDQRVVGLPGNPASAIVTALLFLKPLITGLPHIFLNADCQAGIGANGDRECFLRGRSENLQEHGSGKLKVVAANDQDSSLITPLVEGNCLIRRTPNASAIAANATVDILPIE